MCSFFLVGVEVDFVIDGSDGFDLCICFIVVEKGGNSVFFCFDCGENVIFVSECIV